MKNKTRHLLLSIAILFSVALMADTQTVLITESALPYTGQSCFWGSSTNDLLSFLKEEWNKGRSVTSLAYTADGWFIAMSDNAGTGQQSYYSSCNWPSDWVKEKWDEGFYITQMASSGSHWIVVMSKDPRYSRQSYYAADWSALQPWMEEKWNASYRITAAAFDGSKWRIVMSKVNHIGSQQMLLLSDNIRDEIQQSIWGEGYCLQLLTYGGGQFLIVGAEYTQNNNRSQSYTIKPAKMSDFINNQGGAGCFVAYAGGGISNTYSSSVSYGITASRGSAVKREKSLAALTWLDFKQTSQQKEYGFKIGVKSNSKVDEVKVYVNGTLDRGIVPISNDGYDMTINRTITLAQGQNHIKVVVTNRDGDAVIERDVTYQQPNNNNNNNNNITPNKQQRRIALVIGNSKYKDSDKRLKNPANDATDLSRKLESLGFDVILSVDQSLAEMEQTVNRFAERVKNYDVALFYYAGHGMRSNGYNYLIPVDAVLADESDIKYKCMNVNLVLDKMEKANCSMKIVILDACRNNPFTRGWSRGTEEEGLGTMTAPKGTFIAFSTAPGEVALDGTGRNSPYTAALLQTLDQPNLPITEFFQEVLEKVAVNTNERQTPWTSNSFRGKFYFNQK